MYGATLGGIMIAYVGVPSLSDMQAAVGGLIETAARIESPYRDGIDLDIYVDDEGMMKDGTPVWFVRQEDGAPLAGEIVITAADDQGNTVAATEPELWYALESLLTYRSPVGVVRY